MKYKNFSTLRAMLEIPWHNKLISLLIWMESRHEVFITSAYRKGDTGVHGTVPLRGFDVRSTNFDNPKAVEEEINQNWLYDPARPEMNVALLHDVGQGMHLHLQVHDRSILK